MGFLALDLRALHSYSPLVTFRGKTSTNWRISMFKQLLATATLFCLQPLSAQASALWIGDLSVTTARGSFGGVYTQCDRNRMVQGSDIAIEFGSLTRSVVANLCFRVYSAGLTDAGGNPGELSLKMNYKNAQDAESTAVSYPARFVGTEGSNFVYAVSLFDFVPLYGRSPNGNRWEEIEFMLEGRNAARGGVDYGRSQTYTLRFDLPQN